MAWAKLDDQIFYNKKVAQVDGLAKLLYVAGLVYAANQLTDGFIPQKALRFIANTADVPNYEAFAKQLLDVGLWEEAEDGYVIHDYLEWNPSREQVERTRAARAAAGSRGGLAKKQNSSKLLSKPVAKPKQIASNLLSKTVAKPKQNSSNPQAKSEQNFSASPETTTPEPEKPDSKAQTGENAAENGPENPENSNLLSKPVAKPKQIASNLLSKTVAKSKQNSTPSPSPSPSLSINLKNENKTDRDAEADALSSSSSSVYAPQLSTFHNMIGLVANAQQSEEIFAMLDELAANDALGWWEQAFQIAADKNRRNWSFVRGILNNCLREGHAPQNGYNTATDKPLPTGKATIKIILDGEVVEQEIVTHG